MSNQHRIETVDKEFAGRETGFADNYAFEIPNDGKAGNRFDPQMIGEETGVGSYGDLVSNYRGQEYRWSDDTNLTASAAATDRADAMRQEQQLETSFQRNESEDNRELNASTTSSYSRGKWRPGWRTR